MALQLRLAAYKIDLAVRGGVPWTAEACRRAGTVHVGGTFEEIAEAEAQAARGQLPARPFVLVGQQYLADPTRSAGDVHPIWAYAHVPHGYAGDATEPCSRRSSGSRRGCASGSSPARHRARRLRGVQPQLRGRRHRGRHQHRAPAPPGPARVDPYATGMPGAFLCSASTPPGAGVHGMCGHRAALRAMEACSRRRPVPEMSRLPGTGTAVSP